MNPSNRWWIIVSKLGSVFTFASTDGHEPPDVTRWREAGSAARIIGPLMEAPPSIPGRPARAVDELPYQYRLVATVLLRADGQHSDGQGANAVRAYVTNAVTAHPQVTECLSVVGYLHDQADPDTGELAAIAQREQDALNARPSGCPSRLRAGTQTIRCALQRSHPARPHQGIDEHGMRVTWPDSNPDAYRADD